MGEYCSVASLLEPTPSDSAHLKPKNSPPIRTVRVATIAKPS